MNDLHRRTPLPEAPARGQVVVSSSVVGHTQNALFEDGRHRPPREGMVWWAGRQVGRDFLVLTTVRPAVDNGPQHVIASADTVGRAASAARRFRLGIIAQVHSHPGTDTRHSDGDDELILMPFEGMFSLVVANYGTGGLLPDQGAGLHQFQSGQWIKVTNADDTLLVVPDELLA